MRIFAIGGEPATGKSTLVKSILAELEPSHAFSFGRMKGHVVKSMNLWILGVYNPDETFPGTDRLSMSVQPHAVEFLKQLSLGLSPGLGVDERPASRRPSVLFEGDRLVNGKFLHVCSSMAELQFFVLTTTRGTKDLRHEIRKDTQSMEFLTGRATKTKNLCAMFNHRPLVSETLEDHARNRDLLIAKLKQIGS